VFGATESNLKYQFYSSLFVVTFLKEHREDKGKGIFSEKIIP